MLDNYFGKPTKVNDVDVYPILVVEWEEFESLAQTFLLYGERFVKYKLKAPKETKVFDVIISMIAKQLMDSKGQNTDLIEKFERLFEMVLHKKVETKVNKNGEWSINFDGGTIHRDNYMSFRKIIMDSNLIYEPLIAPNEMSQRALDSAIKSKSMGGEKIDLEAMIVYVANTLGLSPLEFEEMTYYQLRANFEMAQRIEYTNACHIYRSQGAKLDIRTVARRLEIHENPYSFDKLVTKVDANKEKRTQDALGN